MSMPMPDTSDHGSHGSHGGGMDGMGGTGHDMHMMSPFLFARTTGFFILFKEANPSNAGGFAGAMVAVFAFTALATALFENLHAREARLKTAPGAAAKAAAAAMHATRQAFHYATMLIVMTMNIWIILAVLAGHAVGFLLHALFVRPRMKSAPADEPLPAAC